MSSDLFIVGVFLMMLWFYLLNKALTLKLRADQKMPKFINLLYNIITLSLPLYVLILHYIFNNVPPTYLFPIQALIAPGMILMLYVVARNLVTAEDSQPSDFSKNLGTMVLFWVLPVGIFFLQPKIKKIL
jgi:hypothetical protein